MDVSYGKKAKDTGGRGKASKEEWKEREASANQTVPTRIKIFEGGSAGRLTITTSFTFSVKKPSARDPRTLKNVI